MAKPLTPWLVPSFLQHNLRLVVSRRCLHVSVTKFQNKFASLRKVNSPNRWKKFQICCTDYELYYYYYITDMYLIRFLRISRYFSCFCEFRGILQIYLNFAASRPREISEALYMSLTEVWNFWLTLCHKAFVPPWKSYWMELLSTYKKVCGSVISVTERSCVTSLAKAESRISERCSPIAFHTQRAKRVVSDSPRLVDFAIRLVVFVLNLPNGQVLFFGNFKLQKDCNQSC